MSTNLEILCKAKSTILLKVLDNFEEWSDKLGSTAVMHEHHVHGKVMAISSREVANSSLGNISRDNFDGRMTRVVSMI